MSGHLPSGPDAAPHFTEGEAWEEPTRREPVPALEPHCAQAPVPAAKARGIEIEYVLDVVGERDATFLEVWTRNRIYRINHVLVCTEILARAHGDSERASNTVGAALAGGERCEIERGEVHFYSPLPVPGSVAIFCDPRDRKRQIARTSIVEHVVLRLRKQTMSPGKANASPDDLTGRFAPR